MKQFFHALKRKFQSFCNSREWCIKTIDTIFPIFSIGFIVLLLGITLYKFSYDRPHVKAQLIEQDLNKLLSIFKDIDKECNILSIKSEKNVIDFLTVKDFVGSEVGCLVLAYPQKWKGPYLQDNPSMQGKLYEIIKNKKTYYIVPGNGVILPTGKKVGSTIMIDQNADIESMMQEGGGLYFAGKCFACKLPFIIGDWDSPQSKTIGQSIAEINEAMPFSQNMSNETLPQNLSRS